MMTIIIMILVLFLPAIFLRCFNKEKDKNHMLKLTGAKVFMKNYTRKGNLLNRFSRKGKKKEKEQKEDG